MIGESSSHLSPATTCPLTYKARVVPISQEYTLTGTQRLIFLIVNTLFITLIAGLVIYGLFYIPTPKTTLPTDRTPCICICPEVNNDTIPVPLYYDTK